MSLFDEYSSLIESDRYLGASDDARRQVDRIYAPKLWEELSASAEFTSLAPEKQEEYKARFVQRFVHGDPGYDIIGGAKDVGKLLYDIPVQTKGAIGGLLEDADPEERDTIADKWRSEAKARTEQRTSELLPGDKEKKVVPLPRFLSEKGYISRGDVQDTSQSSGFSAVAMGAGAAGGILGTATPVPGGGIFGTLSGAGSAAYKMDKTLITQQLIDATKKTIGRDLTDDERGELLSRTEEVRSNHALWEAGPEAVGTALSLTGIGKIFSGAAKGAATKIIAGIATNLGGELSTETITQIGQNIAEHEMGIGEGEKMGWDIPSSKKALQEVAPSVLVQGGVTGGAGYVAGKTAGILTPEKAKPDPSDILDSPDIDTAIDTFAESVKSVDAKISEIDERVKGTPVNFDGILSPEPKPTITPVSVDGVPIVRGPYQPTDIKARESEIYPVDKIPTDSQPRQPAPSYLDYTESENNDLLYDMADQAQSEQDMADARKRKNDFEALQRRQPLDRIMPAIDKMASELKNGEVSRSAQNEYGETSPTVSTYPDWFKQRTIKDYNKKHGTKISLDANIFDRIVKKVKNGQALTEAQQERWDYIQEVAGKKLNEDPDLVSAQEYTKLQRDGFNLDKPESVTVGSLKPGDEVVVEKNGIPDKLKFQRYDADGNAVLKDGQTLHLDPFEQIQVIGRKSGQSQIKPEEEQFLVGLVEKIKSIGNNEDVDRISGEIEPYFTQNPHLDPYREMVSGAVEARRKELEGENGGYVGAPVVDREVGVGERQTPIPDLTDMVKEAARWHGAAMKVAQSIPDKRGQVRHSRMTTKGDLDAYLMKKFGIDETTARDVSNTLTRDNIPADTTADVEDFAGEPWVAQPPAPVKESLTPQPDRRSGEAQPGKREQSGPVDLDSAIDVLIDEKHGMQDQRRGEDGRVVGGSQAGSLERAAEIATSVSAINLVEAIEGINSAIDNNRPDIAEIIVARMRRTADSSNTTPGFPEGHAKYEQIKQALERAKKEAEAEASQVERLLKLKRETWKIAGKPKKAAKPSWIPGELDGAQESSEPAQPSNQEHKEPPAIKQASIKINEQSPDVKVDVVPPIEDGGGDAEAEHAAKDKFRKGLERRGAARTDDGVAFMIVAKDDGYYAVERTENGNRENLFADESLNMDGARNKAVEAAFSNQPSNNVEEEKQDVTPDNQLKPSSKSSKSEDGSKEIEWTRPTRKQLEEEWYTETLDTMFFSGYPKKGQSEEYREHFIDNLEKFSSIETVSDKDLPRQLYVTDSVDNLAKNIKHMNKDVPGISELIESGKPPMPLVLKQVDGSMKILGGRTRTSLAIMAGKEVRAIVVDEKKMREIFYPLRRDEFLNDGFGFYSLEGKDSRKEIIDYIEGNRKDFPILKHDGNASAQEYGVLVKHLGIKNPADPPAKSATPSKSTGHIAFTEDAEYYEVESGDIHRAPISSPIGADGRRSGRFEATQTAKAGLMKMPGDGAALYSQSPTRTTKQAEKDLTPSQRSAVDRLTKAGTLNLVSEAEALAVLRAAGKGAMSSISEIPGPTKGWYRFTHKETSPMSDWGHAMFFYGDPQEVEAYGDYGWEIDASKYPGEELRSEIKERLENDINDEDISYEYELMQYIKDYDIDVDDIVDSFFPENIIDTADGWDNDSYLKWFWERVAEPLGLRGVKTPDGAISFYPEDISRMEIKYSKSGKIQGFVLPDGTVYIIPENIDGSIWPVVLHEVAAHLYNISLGDDVLPHVYERLLDRQFEDSKTGRAIRKAIASIPESTNQEHYSSEILAYMLEHSREVGIVRMFIARVKRALIKLLGPKFVKSLTVDDIRALAEDTLRSAASWNAPNLRDAKASLVQPASSGLESQSPADVFAELVEAPRNARRLNAWLDTVGRKPPKYERDSYVARRDAKELADIIKTTSFFSKGYGSINTPRKMKMKNLVSRIVGDGKILGSIVGLNSVDVMDMLGGQERSSDFLLNNPAVLINLLSVYSDNSVPVLSDGSGSSIPLSGFGKSALRRAIELPGNVSGYIPFRSLDNFSANGAVEVGNNITSNNVLSEDGAEVLPSAPSVINNSIPKNAESGSKSLANPHQKDTTLPQSARASFAGPKAKGADKHTLAAAQKMEQQGVDRKEIWRNTGWWKLGNDYKFEIDDSLTDIKAENGTLDEVLNHPALFKSYPQLAKVRVRFEDMGETKRGGFDSDKRVIRLNTSMTPAQQRSTLHHEVQHIIQETEGFQGGGNMMALGPKAYAAQTGEVESRLVQRRLNMPPAVRKRTPPWVTLDLMLREEGLLELGQRAEDVLTTSTIEFSEKAEENFDTDLKESAGTFYEKIHDKPDIPFLARIFSTPEYYFKNFPATWKMFNAQLDRHKEKFNLENDILGDFVKVFSGAQKEMKEAYEKVKNYLIETDASGKSYRLKHEVKWEVRDDDGLIVGYTMTKREGEQVAREAAGKSGKHIKDYTPAKIDTWTVIDPKGAEGDQFLDEQEAVEAMEQAEYYDMVNAGRSKEEAGLVSRFRRMTNTAFDHMIADLRKIIEETDALDLPEPTVDVPDETRRWVVVENGAEIANFTTEADAKAAIKIRRTGEKASGTKHAALEVKKRSDAEIMKTVKLSEMIAMMSDLRGQYFPRQRKPGGVILRAVKGDDKIMEKFDLYLAGRKIIDSETGERQERPMSNWLRKSFNTATGFIPFVDTLEKRARQLQAQGYNVTVEKDNKTPESVFDVVHLSASVDALLREAVGNAKKDKRGMNEKAMQEINKILTANVADLFKARGYMSSRLHRSSEYWKGFEEDPLLAGTQYARGIASGIAKRNAAKNMMAAMTGRDQSWAEFKLVNPGGTWEEYDAQVEGKRLDPNKQPQLHREALGFMEEVLRNDEQIDRVIGTMRGLATIKFLGFRVSSAAVNLTNMIMAVPASISSQSGGSIADALNSIRRAAVAYGKYRSGKGELSNEDRAIFLEITNNGWDQAQFNMENAAVLMSKVGRGWAKFCEAAMYMFGAVEKANRATTIFAAYKEVIANTSLRGQEALEKAKHISDRAHGIYGKETIPSWVRGSANPLRLTYTFQKFSHNYMLNMLEMGLKGDRKQAAYMFLSPVLMGGVGSTLATTIISAIATGLGAGDDPEEEFYAWVEETFGSDAVARHGLPGMVGINLKGSIEMNNPFPKTMGELFGAPQAIVNDMLKAAEYAGKGELMKAGEALLPTAVGSMIKAIREQREGITTGSYSPVFYGDEPVVATDTEQFIRALSFNPSRISGIREKQWHEKKVAAKYNAMRSEIIEKFKRFYIYGDGNRYELMKEFNHYNELVTGSGRNDITRLSMPGVMRAVNRARRPNKTERTRP